MHDVTHTGLHRDTSFPFGLKSSASVDLGPDASESMTLFRSCEQCHYKPGLTGLSRQDRGTMNSSIDICKDLVGGTPTGSKDWKDMASCLYHRTFAPHGNPDIVRCFTKCQPLRDMAKRHQADLMAQAPEKNCTFQVAPPAPSTECRAANPDTSKGVHDKDRPCFKEKLDYLNAFQKAMKTTNDCLMGAPKTSVMPLLLFERRARFVSFF